MGPAKRISTGTFPAGSTWTRNPIPASDFQFPPPGEDLSRPGKLLGGFGIGSCFGCNQKVNPKDRGIFGKHYKNNCTEDETNAQIFQWSVVDKVRVPNVAPGDYVVSFRWDSEQTPQVWASCSDVTIVANDD